MRTRERIRYHFHQLGRHFHRKKTGAWSGLSILIFRDDTADHPVRIRINYYIILFVFLIPGLLFASGAYMLIEKGLSSPVTGQKLDTRRALLGTLVLLARENSRLRDRIHTQLYTYQELSNTDPWIELPPVNVAEKVFSQAVDPSRAPVDRISGDLLAIENLHTDFRKVLEDQAYYSLKPVWNRMKIHSITPRGRPVPAGVGYITSPYGMRRNPFNPSSRIGDFHSGVDIASAPGTPLITTASGTVIKVVNTTVSGYGLHVKVHHGLGYTSLYAHNQRNVVSVGDTIKKGDVVGLMGQSGAATGNHVHFEVSYGLSPPFDPMEYVQLK